MLNKFKVIDNFNKNIIIVFLSTSLLNFINLLYQLLIAHRLDLADFASFNSLLSIYMVISMPLASLQTAIAKYSAEFNARGETEKIKALLSGILKKALSLAVLTFFVFFFTSIFILAKLKIDSRASGYLLALLLALSWIMPVFAGGVQGLEFFKWMSVSSVVSGILKITLAFILIVIYGYDIAGALGAFLAAALAGLFISYLPLKRFVSLRNIREDIKYKEIFFYLLPVSISLFCFMGLVNFDMLLVKYFFLPQESGWYSLAQMVGKIILFLPGAISIVMFPMTSGLNAKNLDTRSTLKRSLFYTCILCLAASLIYNILPSLVLKALTGKVYLESIILGRLFSLSMSFFALLFIIITYFLSIKDLRFIKYLVLFTLLQILAIILFHNSLIQVQLILCINAALLFLIHLILIYTKQGEAPLGSVPVLR